MQKSKTDNEFLFFILFSFYVENSLQTNYDLKDSN